MTEFDEDETQIFLKEVSTSQNIQSAETKLSFEYFTQFKIYWPINDRGDLFRIGVSDSDNCLANSWTMLLGKIPKKWLWEPPSRKVKCGSETIVRYYPRHYPPQNKDFKLTETFYMDLVMDKDKGALWFCSDEEYFGEVLSDSELTAKNLSVAFETDGGTLENVKVWILNSII